MIELRADGKRFRIYGAKWITYAASHEPPARLPALGVNGYVAAGETEAIQVALSYVKSAAAVPDCGGAVFADDFPNSPEVRYLAAVVKDVQSKYCTDSKKVFLSGYSSGAFEAGSLGCANSDILRGFGVQIGGGLRGHGPMPCKGRSLLST